MTEPALTLDAMPRKARAGSAFGERLVEIRAERGITQGQLAEMIGSSQRAISGYETVAEYPPTPVVVELAKALKVSADELLGLKPTDPGAVVKITRRFLRRMQQLEELPAHDQKAILKHIDALSAAHKSKRAS